MLQDINEKISKINKIFKTKEKIYVSYLFGSYSNGEATEESDIDIAVYTDYKFTELCTIRDEIKKEIKGEVDLVDISKLGPEFLVQILPQNNIIYSKNEEVFWKWFDISKMLVEDIKYYLKFEEM